ncbi:MAG: 3'-5' exonuclease domain-containing protein 2 [Acidobacteria bacterium]|nr:MAG: 3'-5' exonuclease domain-containing protein 2 [Acidobacteriota bacterium]RLE21645.1 MAG: 3'-5' exonuclease domain-containing protein 2 [Acidobacteriota bacterium]
MNPISTPRLDKEFINTLPPLTFKGRIIEVMDRSSADRIALELMNYELLGFDTESRPSFRKGVTYPVALIQLASEDTAWLFRLRFCGFSENLLKLLSSTHVKKLGIGLRDDISRLKDIRDFQPGGFIELCDLAADKGIIQVGARPLTARYLHHRLIKSSQRSNWAAPTLTGKQKAYAATDAWVCLKLYPKLLADSRSYAQEPEETAQSEQ